MHGRHGQNRPCRIDAVSIRFRFLTNMHVNRERMELGVSRQEEQDPGDAEVAYGDRRRGAPTDRLAMDEAKEREYRTGEREPGRLIEFPVDDIDRDGTKDNAGQCRSAAEYLEPLVSHANLLQFR